MKKICFIGGYGGGKDCSQRLCGPQRMYVELAQRLKKDYQIYFIHIGDNDLMYTANGMKGTIIKKGPLSFLKSLRLLQKLNPDVIHGHGSLNMGLVLYFYKKILQKKTIITFTDFKRNLARNYRILNALDRIIVQTKHGRTKLIRKGVKSSKIKTVTYGIEDTFYTAKTHNGIRSLGKNLVLYYGDARKERGFHHLLEAARLVPKNVTFLFCIRKFEKGFSPSRLLLHKRENMILMRVREYPCSIQDIIKSVDLVVLPFVKNTLEPPLTLMEVSAVGTPLITTNVGGNKEVVAKDAVVLNRVNSLILADAVRQALTRRSKPKKKVYLWEKAIKEFKDIY